MKHSVWKSIVIVSGVVLIGAGVGGWYAMTQVTQLPDWYTRPSIVTGHSQSLTGADLASPKKAQQFKADLLESVESQLAQTAPDTPNGSTAEVSLTPTQVNQWIAASLASDPDLQPLNTAIKGLQTSIDQGTLKTGLVVNPADLNLQTLPQSTRRTLEPILAKASLLKQRELYIGIEGTPQLTAGQLHFDDQTKVVIGTVTIPMSQLSQQFGISPDDLNSAIPLRIGSLKVDGTEIRDRNLVLRGSKLP